MERTSRAREPHESEVLTAGPWAPIFDRIGRIMECVGFWAIRLLIGAVGVCFGGGGAYIGWLLIGRANFEGAFFGACLVVIAILQLGLVLMVLCWDLDDYPEPRVWAHALGGGALVGIGALALIAAYA